MKESVNYRLQKRKETLLTAELLVDLSYRVIMVPHGRDAADEGLLLLARGIKSFQSVRTLVLASGDAGHAFTKIIDVFVSGQESKRVEVVAYDCASKVKSRRGVYFSRIGQGIRIMAKEAGRNINTLGRVNIPPPSSADLIRRSVRKYAKNPMDESIDPRHCSWIRDVIRTWRETFGANGAHPIHFAEIRNALERSFSGDSVPTGEEVEALAKYLSDFTDIFERRQVLFFNPQSQYNSVI